MSACVAAPTITSSFNPQEAEFINRQGSGSISGQAFLRRNDGIVVYAAGSDVVLIPRTAYATERMNALYRGGKFNNLVPDPATTDPRYVEMTRKTRANGEGRFRFENLAAGQYYVVTSVSWRAGDMNQGGNLMETATLADGENLELIMTGQ
ncbi:hypothetical protein [Hoeflea olei]|uniref:Carboxypeptidase regulatory-like domain-containing protein n=1 Tax=Hoeflea olei TaxID=1480615 RepID=A0A1C1YU19_9HYPH|nr:hypothetical protein [Hoeflea olei]OCW56860.1 hypothetical protein AWJ14_06770 [Hoeflea olei]